MPDLDRGFVRTLAGWSSDGLPVASMYLDVDGRRAPRKGDWLPRAESLIQGLCDQAAPGDRRAHTSLCHDQGRMLDFVRGLERGWARGLALFSCSGAGLWEEVRLPRALGDRAVVAPHPYVLPLEAAVETSESFCTVLVDREKARIFLARMGRIQERTDVFDQVPGRHDQGGWAQARYQRHIEALVARHLKRVADVLLRFHRRRGFDHLILAGPEAVLPEFERALHDYLRRRVVARLTLPTAASREVVLERSLAVEEDVEAARERAVMNRLAGEAGSGRHGVMGLAPVLEALNAGRVGTLVAPVGRAEAGFQCASCGWLALGGTRCGGCGGRLERVPDVVERAVAAALRQSSRVETMALAADDVAPAATEVGALLRY